MEVISKVVFLSLKDGKAFWNKFDNNLFTFILQHELYLYNKTKVTYNGQRKHVKTSIELSKRFLCHQNDMLLYKPLSSVCKIMHLSYRFGARFWRTSRFPFRENAIHFCILFVALSESNFSLRRISCNVFILQRKPLLSPRHVRLHKSRPQICGKEKVWSRSRKLKVVWTCLDLIF